MYTKDVLQVTNVTRYETPITTTHMVSISLTDSFLWPLGEVESIYMWTVQNGTGRIGMTNSIMMVAFVLKYHKFSVVNILVGIEIINSRVPHFFLVALFIC